MNQKPKFLPKVTGTQLRMDRLVVPEYTFNRYGNWELRPYHDNDSGAEVFEWGYATGPQWEPVYPVLKCAGGGCTITANRFEREMAAIHLASARGTVVVCGLGMGLYLYNVIQKPGVQQVMVVEQDQDLIDMVAWNAHMHHWLGFHKVKFMPMDPLLVTRGDLSRYYGLQDEPDFVYVDLWHRLELNKMARDLARVGTNLNPRTAGFKGQELALMRWASTLRQPPVEPLDQLSLENFDEWCLWLDMVLQVRSLDYLRYALVCWLNQQERVEFKAQVRQRSKDDAHVEGDR